jgi:hypothetical protein
MEVSMRRLIAALLSLLVLGVLGLVFFAPSGQARSRKMTHVCSATDKQFLLTTKLNMTILGYWSEGLVSGDATPREVIQQVRSVAGQVGATRPEDPSLDQAKILLLAMFGEYLKAVQEQARHRVSSPHIMSAYGLANSAHDVLVDGDPGLRRLGCDVTPLL